MSAAKFIAGDWGTSHLRLSLCDRAGVVLDQKTGPGIAAIRSDVGDVFFSLIEPWYQEHRPLPAVLCGMVGSSIGWREVSYLPCPLTPEMIGRGALCFDVKGREIALAPGLSCTNTFGAPDVMRGEETQILGALRTNPRLREGPHLLCMPGTHTKWVWLREGVIEQFVTSVTGELFDILQRHSVLVKSAKVSDVVGGATFLAAVEQTRSFANAELLHMLFQTRSRQMTGALKEEEAAAYLSGLIIGQDVSGAMRLFREDLGDSPRVVLIGAAKLIDLYGQALNLRGIEVDKIDGMSSAFAGLTALHTIIYGRGVGHAA